MNTSILNVILFIPKIVLSWILVHLMAFFGIFLAVAYPIWWIFSPQTTACFLCRSEAFGSKCPFCRRKIIAGQSKSPANLTSAILNGALMVVFSIVSIGVVIVESRILHEYGFPQTPKTVSFLIPNKGQYRLGEVFPMKIEISGIKTAINTIQADLGFEPAKVEVQGVSTDDSFANIFVQKEINNDGGYVRLTGGLPNPGFLSEQGTFGTVYFKAKEPGVVRIEYLPSSLVLANDGRGTNVLKDLSAVSYLILPERITAEEEEMQKSVVLGTKVLGDRTDNTQMTFYEEEAVLGTTDAGEQRSNLNLLTGFLGLLGKIDDFVIRQWLKVVRVGGAF